MSEPIPGIPRPTPEHQRKITRGKWFEILTVVVLIVLGTAFLYVRGQWAASQPEPAETVAASIAAVQADGAKPVGDAVFFNRHVWSYGKLLTGFVAHIDLVGAREETPLETAIIWLTPQPGTGDPSAQVLQAAVNAAGEIAYGLVHSSALAFEKAAKTMEFISDSPRPHDKGVGASDDGWKLTYITYRNHDDTAAPQPMLCLVLQRLSAGGDPALADMNRVLYDALQSGGDIKTALRAASGSGAAVGGSVAAGP